MRTWVFYAFAVALLVAQALAACPNKCSGHGRCGKHDVCECMQNWTGGDCSGRVCPFTRAWQDTADATDDAHYYAECGNRGTCDRDKGLCICDEPFAGSGCRRMGCPSDCSGHGTCEYIEELAGDGYDKRIGGAWSVKYTLWDQEKIMGCRCDAGFEGYNCAKRVCPKGDDPLTENGVEMVQVIVISSVATLKGFLTYHDPDGNAWTTDTINFVGATPNAAEACANVQLALRRLPNNVLNSVIVTTSTTYSKFTRDSPTALTGTLAAVTAAAVYPAVNCIVSFKSEPGSTGLQNLLGCDVSEHAAVGQHPMSSGSASATCVVYEAWGASPPTAGAGVTRELTELNECSNRGTCDYTTGTCKCFGGHMGLACQNQEALV